MPDLSDTIEELATQPAKASGDGGSVEMPNIRDLIAADQYLAVKTAAPNKNRGLRFTQLVPPGAT